LIATKPLLAINQVKKTPSSFTKWTSRSLGLEGFSLFALRLGQPRLLNYSQNAPRPLRHRTTMAKK
jgi:hypothetical protein